MKEEITTELQFTCPVCGCSDFGLVEAGITAYTPIVTVSAKGRVTYGDTYHDYNNIEKSSYQCADCHYEIHIDGDCDYDEAGLVEWLRECDGDDSEGSERNSVSESQREEKSSVPFLRICPDPQGHPGH